MLFQRSSSPILEPISDLAWANGAVFNPGVCYEKGLYHLLFRAIPKGYIKTPLSKPPEMGPQTGFTNYISYIGYASSSDGDHFVYRDEPFIGPDTNYDRYGTEDPRITKLDDDFYITYTALSEPAYEAKEGIRIGLASTRDFHAVRKYGIIGPPQDKDAVIFPERIDGRVVLIHRVVPNIQLVFFDSLDQLIKPPPDFWKLQLEKLDESVIMRPETEWEAKKIGVGPPPLRTNEGWLVIYHGVDMNHVYRMGMVLLDLENPVRIIARTVDPVMEPETEYELYGDVPNVVFAEGAVIKDDQLHVYYGAADRVIGHAVASLKEVLDHMRKK